MASYSVPPCATFITPDLFAPYLLTLTLRVMPSVLALSPFPSFSTPHAKCCCDASRSGSQLVRGQLNMADEAKFHNPDRKSVV